MNLHGDPSPGTLFIVPTPIGNLEDITLRALRILREALFIAAEDTRHTRKLLTHYDVHPEELFSYHEHNLPAAGDKIVAHLSAGRNGALVSDAGMPAVSDPGSDIVTRLIEMNYPVVVLPGPSASLAALVGSGLDTSAFSFHGFLRRESKRRKVALQELSLRQETLIFYEAPHRLEKMLQDVREVLGNRRFVVARELTKIHEQFVRGNLADLEQLLGNHVMRGEMVVLIEGAKDTEIMEDWSGIPLEEQYAELLAAGMPSKEAMREVARRRGISKRDVYQQLLGKEK